MSDARTFGHKKAATSTFSNPSLVSPITPTLANPVRGFGLPTNNLIQTLRKSVNQQVAQSAGHNISSIALRRPQAKLTVGAPNDMYEQEADRVADQVMSMPDGKGSMQRETMPEEEEEIQTKTLGNSIQREALPEEEEEIQTKTLAATIAPLVQRETMPEEEEELQTKTLGNSIQREALPEEEEEIQTKSSSDAGFKAGSNLENRLSSSQGGGSALPDEVRSFMEPRFGADFSRVRVHTGGEAVQMNRELNAQAFTHKQDVYYGAGKAPGKDALTAHELTHVVQQTVSDPSIQCLPDAISSVSQRIQKDDLSEAKRIKKLNEDYEDAVKDKKWSKAAELLNAFNKQDILNRLAKRSQGEIAAIHQGVLDNPIVGAGSQVAELTRAAYLDFNYENARKLGNWGEAAKFLNGFNEADIRTRLKALGKTEVEALKQGAIQAMPGWSQRLCLLIDEWKPGKQVSSVAMGRIGKAQEAIKHTKSVFSYGAGNQTEALKATNFNSQFRLMVMRDNRQLLDALGETSFWKLTQEIKPIAAANPEALTAAKADLAHGGNCGEHSQVAFDYLRVNARGEALNKSAVAGLDHAFILMGDVNKDSDADIVVADPWPTKATATTWEDHFAYTSDHAKIQVESSMVADGQNVKAVIAAGLTLTDKGKQVAAMKRSDKETKELLTRIKELHFWTHPNTAAKGHEYDYHV
ncbi:MAG: DUF4157 domain-containing protein [Nostoc sp.]|uniref:eCIS core domain-containing protein n=1 Tax=Nostoc sp. TaxID=1180 RepID=UPI002FF7BD0D